ncbi:MAG: hypothetical protein AAGF11_49045 [Myxococcota bacterium]
MIARIIPLALVLPLALATACEQDVRHVELVLGSVAIPDQVAPRGLDCVDQDGRLMACRIYDPDPPVLTMVVDMIPLGGLPRCRANSLQAWCAEATHDCRPDLDRRAIFELSLPPDRSLLEVFEAMKSELSGQVLPNPLVSEPVIVRATFLAQDVATVEAAGEEPSCEALVGCVYSCPVVLDGVEGELPLELDAFNIRCMAEVHQCASNPIFAIEPACSGASGTPDLDPLCR